MKTMRLLLLVALFFSVKTYAQHPGRSGKGMRINGQIYGVVFDEEAKVPIGYANIIVYRAKDSTQVTGTITDNDGFFRVENVRPGRYYVDVDFIGYLKQRFSNIRITPRKLTVNLKEIFLEPVMLQGETVEVEANRAPVTYQIDKKVINVSEQVTALSGSAVDVLENVPSVNVDIDGNVTLRGSGNFQVLIDNRPTILDASEALQQIPASSIENIEIITNPSAKYDPDGVAGIINIILKKNKLKGVSGIANANIGNYQRYGGDFLISYRNKKLVFNVATNFNRRNFPGEQKLERQTTNPVQTTYNNSNGDSQWLMIPASVRFSLDWNLGHWDVLSFGGRLGNRSMERRFDLTYEEWNSLDPQNRIIYQSEDAWKRSGDHYAVNVDYQHRWPQTNHAFNAQILLERRGGDETSFNKLFNPAGLLTESQRSTEEGPATSLRVKADYVQPFKENGKVELGIQGRLRRLVEDNNVYFYDPEQKFYVFQPLFSKSADYQRDIYSAYTTFSSKAGRLGYQLGFRAEYTYRVISVKDSASFKIDRLDLFPTAHLSFEIAPGRQIMASYTRRIRRARGYWLEPFLTWTDKYNVRRGNSGLQPESIDSYEIGHQLFFNKTLISLEGFFRTTKNKVERVRSVFPFKSNVILHTFENVGSDYALGGEILINRDFFKWWKINYMASVYQYRVKGQLFDQDFSRSSFNWSVRLNNDFRLGENTRFQFNTRYRSPSVTSQGRSEGFITADLAVKQQFLDRKLSLTLQARDLFNTMHHEYTSEGPNFYYYRYMDFPSPMLSLTITYIFNNYKKPEKRRGMNGDGDFGGEGDMF